MMNLNDIDTTDTSKYRLIGNSVSSYRFTVPHDEIIYVGDILKIQDAAKDLIFFAKINDLIHDSNFSDSKWDTRPYTENFYGLGEDVYLLAEATPLGYTDSKGHFRKAKTVPTKFSRVEKPDSEDFFFLQQVMGEIEVGYMRTGQDILQDVSVCLHSSVLPQHMGVFATTGMGKSNFMKTFCASCMKTRKFGLLMVDPHGEYAAGGISSTGTPTLGLLHFQHGREGLTVFTTRDEKFRKKYLLNRLYLDYDDFRTPDLLLLYDHSQPQRELVEMLEDIPGSEVIAFFIETDFADFDSELYEGGYPHIAERLKNFSPSTLQVVQRRIFGLLKKNKLFLRKRGSSINDIIRMLHDNRVVLVDIPGMSEQSELLVLSIITRRILRHHQGDDEQSEAHEIADNKKVLITIEEAQRVLGSTSGNTQIFRECAMEGRKFGVGLCVVTQQPKNIDGRILAQLNTFVVMGLGDKNDRATIASSAKQDLSHMDTEIQTLEAGEAVISTPRIPFPVSTRIHLYEEYLDALNQDNGKNDIMEGLKTKF
jgi:DNA helicase HerA-like ATPase